LLLFLVGGLYGVVLEKRQTVDVLRDLGLHGASGETGVGSIVEVTRKKKSGS